MNLHQLSRYRLEILLIGLSAFAGLLLIFSVVQTEWFALNDQAEVVPVSLVSSQQANYGVDAISLGIAPARVDIIGEIIYDQDMKADSTGRMATVQANLLTPVPSLLGPTVTRTPPITPTRLPTATPTITPMPTPSDPWVPIGQATVSCGTEITFNPVRAQKIKMVIAAGGGKDNHVSFYCCGSNGVFWLINGTWQPLFGREDTLNIGDARESVNLTGVTLSRARFYLGCNDRELVTVYLYYLPMPISLGTPTIIR